MTGLFFIRINFKDTPFLRACPFFRFCGLINKHWDAEALFHGMSVA